MGKRKDYVACSVLWVESVVIHKHPFIPLIILPPVFSLEFSFEAHLLAHLMAEKPNVPTIHFLIWCSFPHSPCPPYYGNGALLVLLFGSRQSSWYPNVLHTLGTPPNVLRNVGMFHPTNSLLFHGPKALVVPFVSPCSLPVAHHSFGTFGCPILNVLSLLQGMGGCIMWYVRCQKGYFGEPFWSGHLLPGCLWLQGTRHVVPGNPSAFCTSIENGKQILPPFPLTVPMSFRDPIAAFQNAYRGYGSEHDEPPISPWYIYYLIPMFLALKYARTGCHGS